MTKLRELARAGAQAFTVSQRPDGSDYTHRKDDAPEWVRDSVFAAHGDAMLPDDYIYATVAETLEFIGDTEDDPEDSANAFADDTDVYNSDLTAWVSSNAIRGSYVDEATDTIPAENFYAGLMAGQALERLEIYESVLASLRQLTDDEEDDE